MKDLTVEEVAERRAELRRMRELAFRADAKAKRVAKIKSKAYRRIQKKEKAKKLAKLDNETGEAEDNEEERLKAEIDRARERATLKHKNTGKWAKAMKARGELDVDQRREINEMLDRGEKLRRRIQGQGSDEDSDSDEDDAEDMDTIRANAFDELQKLDDGEEQDVSQGKKGKSVFEMKFMKDAMAREQQKAKQVTDDFIRELGGNLGDDDDEDHNEEAPYSHDPSAQPTSGRVSFRPGNMVSGFVPIVSSLAHFLYVRLVNYVP